MSTLSSDVAACRKFRLGHVAPGTDENHLVHKAYSVANVVSTGSSTSGSMHFMMRRRVAGRSASFATLRRLASTNHRPTQSPTSDARYQGSQTLMAPAASLESRLPIPQIP